MNASDSWEESVPQASAGMARYQVECAHSTGPAPKSTSPKEGRRVWPREGEVIHAGKEPLSPVQARVRPPGSHRPETSRSAVLRARSCTEPPAALEKRARGSRGSGLHRIAALLSGGSSGGEDRRAGEILRQARSRERDPKIGLERHRSNGVTP
jgi:hypothetical protein